MKLTVVGAGPSCPNAGGACSGYLFETEDTALLVDCGPGVVGQLQKHLPYWELSAVVITHMHADHVLDLVPLRYGFQNSPVASRYVPLPLFLPPKGRARLERLFDTLMPGRASLEEEFDVVEYSPRKGLRVGSLSLRFERLRHYEPAWGVRVSDGRVVVAYSGDTGPCNALLELAQDADLFMCEATVPERTEKDWGHMTPAEAGEVARAAGVRRLVLTHVWQELDRDELIRPARAHFGGPVGIATEGKVYTW